MILKDINDLKNHYKSKLEWYFAAIERTESEIQSMWNDYFLSKKFAPHSIKLFEIEKTFTILKDALQYFKQCAAATEKRLEELEKQEYAILNSDDSIN